MTTSDFEPNLLILIILTATIALEWT